MKTYPIALVHLENKRCFVVGGGSIATRKVEGLLDAGADVTVISPDVNPALRELINHRRVTRIARKYQAGDLADAFLVIAATDDIEVNWQVWEDAVETNSLINVVDDPQHCNFIAPAVVRRGEMTIAISSGGNAPALSRHIRKTLENDYGPEYETYLAILRSLREDSFIRIAPENRKAFWEHILNSEIIELIMLGNDCDAQQLAKDILKQYTEKGES